MLNPIFRGEAWRTKKDKVGRITYPRGKIKNPNGKGSKTKGRYEEYIGTVGSARGRRQENTKSEIQPISRFIKIIKLSKIFKPLFSRQTNVLENQYFPGNRSILEQKIVFLTISRKMLILRKSRGSRFTNFSGEN